MCLFNQIGPIILPERLDGRLYLQFLQNQLPGLLANLNLPPEILNNLIYMHDGAPPHFRGIVRDHLNQVYANRWIGRGGPLAWPARSPDLNPLDYFLWGHIKCIVYRGSMLVRNDALGAIQDAFRSVPADMLRRATNTIQRRLEECHRRGGGYIEQYLQSQPGCNSINKKSN